MIKTPENHKFHTRASTLKAWYQTRHGPVPVHGPVVGDRCSKSLKVEHQMDIHQNDGASVCWVVVVASISHIEIIMLMYHYTINNNLALICVIDL